MTPQNLKTAGIACFGICAICLFIAFERYQTNASNVNAMLRVTQAAASPFIETRPITPTTTKLALSLAFIFAAGGTFCFVRVGRHKCSEDNAAQDQV